MCGGGGGGVGHGGGFELWHGGILAEAESLVHGHFDVPSRNLSCVDGSH